MPNSKTFKIKACDKIIHKYMKPNQLWADPFARDSTLAKDTNDLNPNTLAKSHVDALDFLKSLESNHYDGVLYDPPYNLAQMKQCYDGNHIKVDHQFTNNHYWKELKLEIARIIKPGGYSISFNWNTCGIGKCNGFEIIEVLDICHGAMHYDTLVTVEKKIIEKLF